MVFRSCHVRLAGQWRPTICVRSVGVQVCVVFLGFVVAIVQGIVCAWQRVGRQLLRHIHVMLANSLFV